MKRLGLQQGIAFLMAFLTFDGTNDFVDLIYHAVVDSPAEPFTKRTKPSSATGSGFHAESLDHRRCLIISSATTSSSAVVNRNLIHYSPGHVLSTYHNSSASGSSERTVTGIFMGPFVVGALVYGWMYWKNVKRPTRGSNGDRLSALMICFCLAEALVCVFRIAWASTDIPVVIFLALVSESIASVSLFTVNFLLTKRLVRLFDLRSSLWTRSIIASVVKYAMAIACSLVILLHVLGAGLHEFNRNAGEIEQSGARLLQASTGLLMIIGFIFLVVVVAASTAANRSRVEEYTARMTVFFIGAGVLTMMSQISRFASTFTIWQPTDQVSIGILSRPVYYITGFGMSVSIIVLYAAARIDLLFGKMPTSNGRSSPQPSKAEQWEAPMTLKPKLRESPLRLNPIWTPTGHDGRYYTNNEWMDSRSPMTASSTGTFMLEKTGNVASG
ncbi:hypothetical protein LA080_001650 [Diaporthe eres]|nr:hypothetical protein LA080_001650 [Diaporthe eres]